jgi:hypothetical protein
MREREVERQRRAATRAAGGMLVEPIASLDEERPLHDETTPEDRLQAMAQLCRRAWLATGRPWPSCPRAELPGELFVIDDGRSRRAP